MNIGEKRMRYPLPPGNLLEKLIVWGAAKSIFKNFENRTKNFLKIQEQTLDEIIKKNAGTRWGRDYKFLRLNHENWGSIPLVTYEQVKPYVDKIKQGDFHALTNESPEALAITSGTTAEPKYIPLTSSSIKSQKIGGDVWNLAVLKRYWTYGNKVLVLSGGSKKKDTELLPIKSYTCIVREKQSSYIQNRMIFPKKVDYISDLEHRLLIAAQQAFIRRPLTLISANPLTILRLLELTESNRAEIKKATINGKYIGTNIEINRIKNKENILKDISNKTPLDSVRFIGTWLGGTQHLFIDKLKKQGLNVIMRDLGYIATEGRFTISLEDNVSNGVLNPFGNFYEFTTLDKKNFVPIQELQEGEEYNLIITGENGLYRYDMQDIIRVEGRYNQAPVISFRRKDMCFSSLTGEKFHENHVVELLKEIRADGFLVAEAEPPHYSLRLPAKYPVPNADVVDKLLQKINIEYSQKRESDRLQCLEIRYLDEEKFRKLDREINPNQEHDRFKRKYLVPLG